MIVLSLVLWLVPIAWPGMQVSILVLSGALVAWATFRLPTQQYVSTPMRSSIASATVSWQERRS